MLISLFRYLSGYIKLKVEGNAIERFFTLCGKKDILLWNITYKKDYYECLVSARGLEEMEAVVEKTNTKLTILEKHGLPFFLHCHRKRKIFMLGFFLCIFLVYILSRFVWDIEVIGTYSHTEEEIIKYMRQKNILSGIPKKKVNCAKLEEDMREDFDDVAWVSCELDGTRLTVHLKESLQTDTSKKEEKPHDISARKSATVTSIVTREGTPLVKKGDKVKKGDTLISGLIYIYDDANEMLEAGKVAADGDVYGKTTYKYEDFFESSYYEKKYTGEKLNNYTIQVGEYQIKLWKKMDKNKLYDVLSEKEQIKIGTNLYLPVAVEKITWRSYEQKRKTDTKQEMEKKARKRLNKFLDGLKKKGVSILENHVRIEVNERGCSAKGNIIVNESIGKIRSIQKNAVEDSLKEKQQKDSEGQ